MKIIIPSLTKKYMEGMVACAHVETSDDLFGDLIQGPGYEGYSLYGKAKSQKIACVYLSESDDVKHFHLEVFKEKSYRTWMGEDKSMAIEDFHNVIDRAIGFKATVDVMCGYMIPSSKLPADGLIHGSAVEVKVAGVALQTSAAEILIRGGPIDEISWRLIDKGKKVKVALRARLTGIIDEYYMVTLSEHFYESFESLVLGTDTIDSETTK